MTVSVKIKSNHKFSCTACPAGTYRSRSDPADSCLPCPANTATSGVAVANCSCIAGHFRALQDGPKIACARKSYYSVFSRRFKYKSTRAEVGNIHFSGISIINRYIFSTLSVSGLGIDLLDLDSGDCISFYVFETLCAHLKVMR